jgi:hypothetical protein
VPGTRPLLILGQAPGGTTAARTRSDNGASSSRCGRLPTRDTRSGCGNGSAIPKEPSRRRRPCGLRIRLEVCNLFNHTELSTIGTTYTFSGATNLAPLPDSSPRPTARVVCRWPCALSFDAGKRGTGAGSRNCDRRIRFRLPCSVRLPGKNRLTHYCLPGV